MTFTQTNIGRWVTNVLDDGGRYAIENFGFGFAVFETVATATVMVGEYKTLNDAKTAAWIAHNHM